MQLKSYVQGRCHAGDRDAQVLRDATTGQVIAEASSSGIDFAGVLDHARRKGGPALRQLTFHERAALLKRIGTLFAYASRGARELPNNRVYVDGEVEALSKTGTFIGQHICVPLEGAAIHINAFNFPVWGMLEKLAPALLAGMPVIVKPASQTAYVAELAFRHMVESQALPPGSIQLLCGAVGDLFDPPLGQATLASPGSAATAHKLRCHPAVVRESVRFNAEADSLNCSILGPDAAPGTEELGLFVTEGGREMTRT